MRQQQANLLLLLLTILHANMPVAVKAGFSQIDST
jgi:hypothetical protein